MALPPLSKVIGAATEVPHMLLSYAPDPPKHEAQGQRHCEAFHEGVRVGAGTVVAVEVEMQRLAAE